ncbi:sulfotransferase family 2 domain-containing protein [Abyssibius alkaniclasticus]|uniref:sulfotransferase family 2 domain-containing protein n=1 Tax=Abyssibius alkaniclasticus TaxID=2881234 RepID=UPI0040584C5D
MIISNSRKFIFVHIHKAAGTALKVALQPHLAWNDLVIGGSQFGDAVAPAYETHFGLTKHGGIQQIIDQCGAALVKDYFSFAIVRDPVARSVSLYNYIAEFFRYKGQSLGLQHDDLVIAARQEQLEMTPNLKFLDWPATRAYYLSPNFSDYIRSKELESDSGFQLQIDALQNQSGTLMVDKVIKYEALLRDLPALWDKIGTRFMLPVENRPKFYRQPLADVSDDDRAFLRTRFADDYLALDYA